MHRFQFTRRLLEILHDARLSVRALIARPLFTLTTVMTFALGIGATAVVFSLVHSVLLSPLPYREPDRLAFVQQVIPEMATGCRSSASTHGRSLRGNGLPADLREDGSARRVHRRSPD